MVIHYEILTISCFFSLKNRNTLEIKNNLGSKGKIFPLCLSDDSAPPCLDFGNYGLKNREICYYIE